MSLAEANDLAGEDQVRMGNLRVQLHQNGYSGIEA